MNDSERVEHADTLPADATGPRMLRPEAGMLLDGGRYRVVRYVGRGAMGTVFEGEVKTTGRRIALKFVDLSSVDGDERDRMLKRVKQEARLAARVQHPNVVDVYEVFPVEGGMCVAMEYLEGETLEDRLKRGLLTIEEALAIIVPITRGLAAVHGQGVIHRDIKPANIFLERVQGSADPLPKLLDFGVSTSYHDDPEHIALTRTGALTGTPLYMALECFEGRKKADARSDVHAIGAVLYEMLTGALPHDAGSVPNLIYLLMSEDPTPPRKLRPEISPELEGVVMRALARKCDDRTESAERLAIELKAEWKRLVNGSWVSISVPAPMPTRAWWKPAMFGLSLLLGLGALARSVGSDSPAKPAPAEASATPAATPSLPATSHTSIDSASTAQRGGATEVAPAPSNEPHGKGTSEQAAEGSRTRPKLGDRPAMPNRKKRAVAQEAPAQAREPAPEALPTTLAAPPAPIPSPERETPDRQSPHPALVIPGRGTF